MKLQLFRAVPFLGVLNHGLLFTVPKQPNISQRKVRQPLLLHPRAEARHNLQHAPRRQGLKVMIVVEIATDPHQKGNRRGASRRNKNTFNPCRPMKFAKREAWQNWNDSRPIDTSSARNLLISS